MLLCFRKFADYSVIPINRIRRDTIHRVSQPNKYYFIYKIKEIHIPSVNKYNYQCRKLF